MIDSNNISMLIVSAVNDENRLKSVYNHLRSQYPTNEIVVIYDNFNKKILPADDPFLVQIVADERVYVSKGYNLAIKNCTKPYFVFLHDDTYTAPNFLENLAKHLTDDAFCNFAQIEHPIFNNPDLLIRPIRDFGRSAETFDKKALDDFYWSHIKKLTYTTEPSIYGGFFMAGNVDLFKRLGMFDEAFQPYFFEDSDLMVRIHLAGYGFVFVIDAMVYHMGSLTSRTSSDSHLAHNTTQNIFIKKWKTTFDHYKTFSMLNGNKYVNPEIRIEAQNCNPQLQSYLDLYHNPDGTATLKIDGTNLTQADVDYLPQIPYLVQDTQPNSVYALGNLILTT